MSKKEVVIENLEGKYDNPIAELVHVACQFKSRIAIIDGNKHYNAKSIMGIMAFNPSKGMQVTVETSGEDEEAAISAMEAFLLCK